MQGEHCIIIENFRHELYFADSVGCKRYSFLNNQHYKQMMPATLQFHPSVCGIYTIYAAFISSSFDSKNLQGITILLYSLLKVVIYNFSILVSKCAVYNLLLPTFIHSNKLFLTSSNYHTIFLHSIKSYQYKGASAEGSQRW